MAEIANNAIGHYGVMEAEILLDRQKGFDNQMGALREAVGGRGEILIVSADGDGQAPAG